MTTMTKTVQQLSQSTEGTLKIESFPGGKYVKVKRVG